MAALLWFLLAGGLLAIAALGADLDGLLPAAASALGLSVLTAFQPALALVPQLLLFAAATVVLLLALQRWSRRRRARAIPASDSSERATVISGFDGPGGAGRVRWQGQSWAATNLEPQRPLLPGAAVQVMGRDGTHLQVLPPAPEQAP